MPEPDSLFLDIQMLVPAMDRGDKQSSNDPVLVAIMNNRINSEIAQDQRCYRIPVAGGHKWASDHWPLERLECAISWRGAFRYFKHVLLDYAAARERCCSSEAIAATDARLARAAWDNSKRVIVEKGR